ncbi:LamG-like jellyroll fold domain-containing protein [Actinoplanes sp. G11-F43]|uniref:LamG-like jellyroll fold domain-containing protein n=1 Tax=Actinoplanes sp. G11-F43 TaxID=3424130 RepID=UPI003D337361
MAGIDTPAGYTRLERTGTGADAGVYRAWDERAGRWVVLRLFHRFVGDRSEESAFAAYVATSLGLGRNTTIVPVRAGGVTATGRPWLALDPVDARPFSDVLRDDPPSPAVALELTIALADALAWAQPMTHGRVRAESVLIGVDGVPMITDFAAPRPPGTPPPTQRDDVTDLAALMFRAVTGGPWPGRGLEDVQIIGAWPGLTGLFDEVLTPVPAVETMAEFAARLRQVRLRAGARLARSSAADIVGLTSVVPASVVAEPMIPEPPDPTDATDPPDPPGSADPTGPAGPVPSAPALGPAVPAVVRALPMDGAPSARPRRLPALAAALVLLPIGFGVVQLFPGRAGDAAEPPISAVESSAPPDCAPASAGPSGAPALWWPADEGSGQTLCDRSGSGNEAALSPDVGWSASGAAMRFDPGTDAFVSGSGPAVRTDQSFTVMAWVNLADTDGPHGVLSQPGASASGFTLKYEKSNDSWRLTMPRADRNAPELDGTSASSRPRVGTWTHLAATFDAEHGEITIFVDGVAEGTAEHTATWDAPGPVQVARSWSDGVWTDRFHGLIDDVRAYRTELSADGITEIVETSRPTHQDGR